MQILSWLVIVAGGLLFTGIIPGCDRPSADAEQISGAIKVLGICGVVSSIVWAISIIGGTSIYKGD
jgi:hypothetical protein